MPLIIIGICLLFGIGGVAYGADQHNQRERDRAEFRARLEQLEKALSEKEVELAALRARLGEKNDQVRILAEEVQRLRREIEAMRRAA